MSGVKERWSKMAGGEWLLLAAIFIGIPVLVIVLVVRSVRESRQRHEEMMEAIRGGGSPG
jgi:preprotein translocase subunit YajC